LPAAVDARYLRLQGSLSRSVEPPTVLLNTRQVVARMFFAYTVSVVVDGGRRGLRRAQSF
jgi:hypothetical protein